MRCVTRHVCTQLFAQKKVALARLTSESCPIHSSLLLPLVSRSKTSSSRVSHEDAIFSAVVSRLPSELRVSVVDKGLDTPRLLQHFPRPRCKIWTSPTGRHSVHVSMLVQVRVWVHVGTHSTGSHVLIIFVFHLVPLSRLFPLAPSSHRVSALIV